MNIQPLRSTLGDSISLPAVRHKVGIATKIVRQAESVSKFMDSRSKIKAPARGRQKGCSLIFIKGTAASNTARCVAFTGANAFTTHIQRGEIDIL